jgi:4-hydroxybenzoate polyprenyltransferase
MELTVLRHELEALWWLGRPASIFGKVPMALAGWSVAASDRCATSSLAFAVCAQLLITSLNDVYDAARDAVTAPYLPIPSGAISRRGALVVPAVCGLALVILLAVLVSIRDHHPRNLPAEAKTSSLTTHRN